MTEVPAETVALRFDWPVGLAAQVTMTGTRVRTGSRADSTAATIRYGLAVEADPRGRRILHRTLEIESGADVVTAEASAALAGLQPDYVVSDAGALVDLADAEATIARYHAVFAPMLDEVEAENPQAASQIGAMLSPEMLLMSVSQMWEPVVGFWVGADLDIGAWYEIESEGSVPIFPDAMIPMTTEFAAAERVACMEAETEAQCVRLIFETYPDEAAVAALVASFFETVGATDTPRFEHFEVITGGEVITDPTTLRPYTVTTYKEVAVETVAPDGTRERGTQSDTKHYTYVYTAP